MTPFASQPTTSSDSRKRPSTLLPGIVRILGGASCLALMLLPLPGTASSSSNPGSGAKEDGKPGQPSREFERFTKNMMERLTKDCVEEDTKRSANTKIETPDNMKDKAAKEKLEVCECTARAMLKNFDAETYADKQKTYLVLGRSMELRHKAACAAKTYSKSLEENTSNTSLDEDGRFKNKLRITKEFLGIFWNAQLSLCVKDLENFYDAATPTQNPESAKLAKDQIWKVCKEASKEIRKDWKSTMASIDDPDTIARSAQTVDNFGAIAPNVLGKLEPMWKMGDMMGKVRYVEKTRSFVAKGGSKDASKAGDKKSENSFRRKYEEKLKRNKSGGGQGW